MSQDRSAVGRREFLIWTGAALAGATCAAIPWVPGNRVEAADSAGPDRVENRYVAYGWKAKV